MATYDITQGIPSKIVAGDILNCPYSGTYKTITLPKGTYKIECWGAQGGSNGTNSTYGITAKAGGKGGYSKGILTLTSETTVRIYVGGAGSSSAGGFNGGGSTSGSSSYSSGNEYGVSRMGGGGGASDIRLSDGALLSRMIVAGGGSGGAMLYKQQTTTTSTTTTVSSFPYTHKILNTDGSLQNNNYRDTSKLIAVSPGDKIHITYTSGSVSGSEYMQWLYYNSNGNVISTSYQGGSNWNELNDVTIDSNTYYVRFMRYASTTYATYPNYYVMVAEITHYTTVTQTSTDFRVGFAGGGTNGVGYSSSYYGSQTSAGSGGSFGQGANQGVTNYRYCSGAGGGGWYGGGGGQYSDYSTTTCKYSGGGSGWVNIAANASYRPSGYTGLELDSGETKAGNTSFPSTSGGTETGHSGNGYVRITVIPVDSGLPLKTKVGNEIVEASSGYVKVGGEWKEINSILIKKDGEWISN